MHDSWQSDALNSALLLLSKLLEVDLQWYVLQLELGRSVLIFLHAVIETDLEDFFLSISNMISRINQSEHAIIFLQTFYITLDIAIMQLKCPSH